MTKSRNRQTIGPRDVVSAALHGAMERLGIESARFRAMPSSQRRLALCEAIYRTASKGTVGSSWIKERAELGQTPIERFSPEQIQQHRIVVDALTALVCLGESTFVRSLVSYLSFPEPRWSITIDSVLRAVVFGESDPPYRLPNQTNLCEWRQWAVKQRLQPKMSNFSEYLITQMGAEEETWHERTSRDASGVTWLALARPNVAPAWHCFSEPQAYFCAHSLYPALDESDARRLVGALDAYLKEHLHAKNFGTLVACLSDELPHRRLRLDDLTTYCLSATHDRSISPTCAVLVYQAVSAGRGNKELTRSFADALFGSQGSRRLRRIATFFLEDSSTTRAIHSIAWTFRRTERFPDRVARALDELAPRATGMIFRWLSRLFATEVESACLVGLETPAARSTLISWATHRFKRHDKALLHLSYLCDSSDASYRKIGTQVGELYKRRWRVRAELSKRSYTDPRALLSEYEALLDDWLSLCDAAPPRSESRALQLPRFGSDECDG